LVTAAASDTELVRAVVGHRDERAFALLVGRHERSVRAAAYAVLRDRHAAEDAAQEAFVVAYRAIAKLRDGAAFGGWVRRIAKRQALAIAARRGHVAASIDAAADVAAPAAPGDLAPDAERLLAAVMRLPEHERRVVMLRHFDGHDVHAIARITARPVGTVTKQLSRGHARIRERLEGNRP
jgi:RNA polymerase sigma-70 factor (ECF subfamily)